jgi:predicted secreted Zn-dependent protease
VLRLALLAAAATAIQPIQAMGPSDENAVLRSLQDVPGIKIAYYDVSGTDTKSINRMIQERHNAGRAGTDWNVAVKLDKRTEGSSCVITRATVQFNATANLPRLTGKTEGTLPLMWQLYVGGLESELAQRLWFAYDRIGNIERAFAGKACDQGVRDGQAAIAQLKKDFAALSASSLPGRN